MTPVNLSGRTNWRTVNPDRGYRKQAQRTAEAAREGTMRSSSSLQTSTYGPLPVMRNLSTVTAPPRTVKELRFSARGKPDTNAFRGPNMGGWTEVTKRHIQRRGARPPRRPVPAPKVREVTDADNAALSKMNALYDNSTFAMLATSGRMRGRRALVIGCGRSKNLLQLVKMGASELVFLDADSEVVRSVDEMLAGREIRRTALAVHGDAMELGDCFAADKRFDVIIATKCVGQMLANAQNMSMASVLSHWSEYLSDSGVIVVDNLKFIEDSKIVVDGLYSDLLSASKRKLMIATNCMKFNDAAYNIRLSADPADLDVEYKWYPAGPHPADIPDLFYQSWIQFILRKRCRIEERVEVFLPTHKTATISSSIHSGPLHPTDTKCNAVLAIGANGQKMPIANCDKEKFQNLPLLPKFDGTRCTLLLDDNKLLVFSSNLRTIKHHGKGVGNHRYMMQAELLRVFSKLGDKFSPTDHYVACVVGLMEVDGERRNVNDHTALRELNPVVKLLETMGVFLTSFSRCSTIVGNFARIFFKSAPHYVPVDGINVPLFGEYGKFFKPMPFCTIDSTVGMFPSQLCDAMGKLFLVREGDFINELRIDTPGDLSFGPSDVVEFSCVEFPKHWKVCRVRHDKSRPASQSRVVLDLACAGTAQTVMGRRGNTVEALFSFLRVEAHKHEDVF